VTDVIERLEAEIGMRKEEIRKLRNAVYAIRGLATDATESTPTPTRYRRKHGASRDAIVAAMRRLGKGARTCAIASELNTPSDPTHEPFPLSRQAVRECLRNHPDHFTRLDGNLWTLAEARS